jgi:hypothetical protein
MYRIHAALCLACLLAARPTFAEEPTVTVQKIGLGPSVQDAEDNALDQCREWVAEQLRRRYGERSWAPSVAQLQRDNILWPADSPTRELLSDGVYYKVVYTVTLTPAHWQKFEERIQHQRVEERHHLMVLVLIGIAVALGVLSVYLYLEEATKGYYTGLLRLGALAVVVLAVLGLWWIKGGE